MTVIWSIWSILNLESSFIDQINFKKLVNPNRVLKISITLQNNTFCTLHAYF